MGRGWSAIRLFIVTLFVLSACTATATPSVVVLPIGGGAPYSIATQPEITPSPVPRIAQQARAPQPAIPYRVTPEWRPTQVNFDWGRKGTVDYIVIHYTAISYARTLKAFSLPSSGVSAHYVVRYDGHVAQLVGESNVAWHAGNEYFNEHSVGIEIEKSYESNPDFTPDEYYAAAALACQIAARHGIPLDRAHVIGHNEVPWPNNHSDPGPTWNWPFFMWLTSLCAPPTATTVHASFVSQSPFPDLVVGANAAVTVVLKNTGATAWRKGTPQEARLGVRGNSKDLAFLGRDWPTPDRVAVQAEDIVPPGGTATFTFSVGASEPGTYVLPLRGVVDGGAWMDDIGMYVVVNARPAKTTLE
jgi:N-acetyl-anhydromuramyl-L-alanine amidase AmpD